MNAAAYRLEVGLVGRRPCSDWSQLTGHASRRLRIRRGRVSRHTRIIGTLQHGLGGRGAVRLFEIVSTIGAGGMGEVYRARDTRRGRTVTMKILPRGLRATVGSRVADGAGVAVSTGH